MQATTVFLLLRLVFGLLLGVLISLKLKDPIRSFVLMLIPLRHRISERSYRIQTRAGTIMTFLIIIGTTLGVTWGVGKVGNMFSKESTTVMRPLSTWKPTTKRKLPTPQIRPAPAENQQPVASPPVETQEGSPTNELQSYEEVTTDLNRLPEPPRKRSRKPGVLPEPEVPHYAQVSAFTTLAKAQAQQSSCQRDCSTSMWIAYVPEDQAPYKVLAGPFVSRSAANAFLRKQGWPGYPRQEEGLTFFKSN